MTLPQDHPSAPLLLLLVLLLLSLQVPPGQQ
jgi:hypothetical protein